MYEYVESEITTIARVYYTSTQVVVMYASPEQIL